MRVTVNGDAREIGADATVATLVADLLDRIEGVAVAVNEELVPRSLWRVVELKSEDRVEVLTASQGG